jgi:Fe2+-dicitrate sensor, membrane component
VAESIASVFPMARRCGLIPLPNCVFLPGLLAVSGLYMPAVNCISMCRPMQSILLS